ncbi:2OG-Fe(II) oxygenase superfamily protein [Colletotrichum tofieldiae]|uniref:2OG-Fe(II) oxygenase superfamily protein n=1 Tax=Colletotrichum tofieldiae TaxID=708197 RepID=A0A166VQJ3_9PEZI|nr:2OG-Fe(II) oxygenase superfamily protein [Colletotrichum tofieldiae]GKT56092.1 2OG-Fe(II) oxygenase superfamily protein [Colletotrichum tofieldiae]GKT81452.1 2OG-Fe(II) oxygenase superfamily protein [Colletotrichum tofieldiae]
MVADINQLPPYTTPPPTQEDLDYVDLVNIDLSKFDDPEGRKQLARDLYEAATGYGFLTLTNHGISDETYERQMRIANAAMTLKPNEKEPYEVTPEEDARGLYAGYKPAGPLGHKGGFPKALDHYNMLVHDPKNRPHPEIIRPFMEETYEVMSYIRTNILVKLLKLVAMILEVPDDSVLSTHAPGGSRTEYLRYPIAALQVLCHHTGRYRHVKHQPHGIVVNFGEALERLTGGLFKATIHRVIQPPEDQRHLRRIGVIYFSRPADERELVPIENSPLLQRMGTDKPIDERIFCMADYLDARKHGWKRYDFDIDRPREEGKHQDPFDGEYTDPEGHKSLGKFDNVPRLQYSLPAVKSGIV